MLRTLVIVVIAVATLGFNTSQAQTTDARLRIMQLSYLELDDGAYALAADISVDDTAMFQNVSFPFTTDFISVPAGTHVLRTMITGHESAAAMQAIELTASHDYSVIVSGEYGAGNVDFVVVDHTDLPLQETSSAAILVNLYPNAIDVYFDDTRVAESIARTDHAVFSVPLQSFTASVTSAGRTDDVLHTSDYAGLPNTTYLAVTWASTSGDLQIVQHLSSDLTAAEYLQSLSGETELSSSSALIEPGELLDALDGDGPLTIFVPTNDVLADVAQDTLPDLAHYAIPQHLPPYTLSGHNTLATISGQRLTLDFGDTESGYWEINGAPILWDVRVANGIIYALEGLVLSP